MVYRFETTDCCSLMGSVPGCLNAAHLGARGLHGTLGSHYVEPQDTDIRCSSFTDSGPAVELLDT